MTRKVVSTHACIICGNYATSNIQNTDIWLCRREYNRFSDARDKAHKNYDECTTEEAITWTNEYIRSEKEAMNNLDYKQLLEDLYTSDNVADYPVGSDNPE